MSRRPTTMVVALGFAQIIAWGSTYYLPAILAPAIAAELQLPQPTVFAAFSVALVLSALVGPAAGRAIDRHGGRPVLALTSLLFALGLLGLAESRSVLQLFLAWAVLGVGMGSGLYESAFAAVVRVYGTNSRNAITGITLIAGFASTVAWPLSQWLLTRYGWRASCEAWAAIHLFIALPLNLSIGRAPALPVPSPADPAGDARVPATAPHATRNAVLLAYSFAITRFIAAAMASHWPAFLATAGVAATMAVTAGALIGPAQVAGRLLEFGFLRRVSPLLSARLSGLTHPLGCALLVWMGAAGAIPFALLHGLGNGILTIANGTLPLLFFGAEGYGARQGRLMMPARVAQALAPFVFGIAVERLGLDAAWLSAALGFSMFLALLGLRRP